MPSSTSSRPRGLDLVDRGVVVLLACRVLCARHIRLPIDVADVWISTCMEYTECSSVGAFVGGGRDKRSTMCKSIGKWHSSSSI